MSADCKQDNRAKQFARKYRLSPRDMATLFGVSPALASRWLSEVEESNVKENHVLAIETLDLLYQTLYEAEMSALRLRLKMCPSKLQIYEDWRDRQD